MDWIPLEDLREISFPENSTMKQSIHQVEMRFNDSDDGKRSRDITMCKESAIHISTNFDRFTNDTVSSHCHVDKRIKLCDTNSKCNPLISDGSNNDKNKCMMKRHDNLEDPNKNGLCYVCRLPYAPYLSPTEPTLPKIQNNTLLSYFPSATVQPISNRSMRTAICSNNPQVARRRSRCFFCERSNICMRCLTDCEQCNETFCTLCVTVDYNISISRTLCLECVVGQKTCTQLNNDADRMHVGD